MAATTVLTVDTFLAQPLVARLATNGPTVRPVWFLWEDGALWWITGAYSRLPQRLAADPRVALVVDTCDLDTGTVLQVTASGDVGEDVERWPERFRAVLADPEARFAKLTPRRPLTIVDQSFG